MRSETFWIKKMQKTCNPHLSKNDLILQAKELHEDGVHIKDIAPKMGLSYMTIYNWKNNNFKTKDNFITKEMQAIIDDKILIDIEKAELLDKKGLRMPIIAQALKISPTNIYHWRKKKFNQPQKTKKITSQDDIGKNVFIDYLKNGIGSTVLQILEFKIDNDVIEITQIIKCFEITQNKFYENKRFIINNIEYLLQLDFISSTIKQWARNNHL